jgi:hypothetical protein
MSSMITDINKKSRSNMKVNKNVSHNIFFSKKYVEESNKINNN